MRTAGVSGVQGVMRCLFQVGGKVERNAIPPYITPVY